MAARSDAGEPGRLRRANEQHFCPVGRGRLRERGVDGRRRRVRPHRGTARCRRRPRSGVRCPRIESPARWDRGCSKNRCRGGFVHQHDRRRVRVVALDGAIGRARPARAAPRSNPAVIRRTAISGQLRDSLSRPTTWKRVREPRVERMAARQRRGLHAGQASHLARAVRR